VVTGLTLLVIAVLTGVVLIGYVLSQSAPAWWRTIDTDDPALVVAADELEQAVGRQLTLVRPPAERLLPGQGWQSSAWTTFISVDDANAWLNVNLPEWLASDPDMPDWPESIETLQVRFVRDRIDVGVSIRHGREVRYVSASVEPRMGEDGSLWLPATSIHIGRLPLPAGVMLAKADGRLEALIPAELHDKAQTLLRMFRGIEPVPNPVIRLGDGRQVRLLEILPRRQKLIVTCRTELSGASRGDRPE